MFQRSSVTNGSDPPSLGVLLLLLLALANVPAKAVQQNELRRIAKTLMQLRKGILAADESKFTLEKRLAATGLKPPYVTAAKQWREVLLTAPSLDRALTGVILHPDTLPQTTAWKVNLAASSDSTGTGDARGKKKSASKGGPVRLIDALSKAGVLIGAKLDLGLSHFEAADIGTGKASSKEQHAGQGLDQLRDRCLAAKDQGATFSKYRAVFHVEAAAAEGPSLAVGLPTSHAVERNAQDLAEYAAVSQGCGLVPMVEPEVLCGEMDMRVPPGSTAVRAAAEAAAVQQALDLCQNATEHVLKAVMAAVQARKDIDPGAVILKVNMMTPPSTLEQPKNQSLHKEVADRTVAVLSRTVPASFAGIAFLSGGMSEQVAVHRMAALSSSTAANKPWPLTFSFGRALQAAGLSTWAAGVLEGQPHSQTAKHVKQAQTQVVKAALLAGMGVVSRDDILKHADAWKTAAKENAEVGIDITPAASRSDKTASGSRSSSAEQDKEEVKRKVKKQAQSSSSREGKGKSEL